MECGYVWAGNAGAGSWRPSVRRLGLGSWEGLGRSGVYSGKGTVFVRRETLQYFNNHYDHPGANLLKRADRAEADGHLWTMRSFAA